MRQPLDATMLQHTSTMTQSGTWGWCSKRDLQESHLPILTIHEQNHHQVLYPATQQGSWRPTRTDAPIWAVDSFNPQWSNTGAMEQWSNTGALLAKCWANSSISARQIDLAWPTSLQKRKGLASLLREFSKFLLVSLLIYATALTTLNTRHRKKKDHNHTSPYWLRNLQFPNCS